MLEVVLLLVVAAVSYGIARWRFSRRPSILLLLALSSWTVYGVRDLLVPGSESDQLLPSWGELTSLAPTPTYELWITGFLVAGAVLVVLLRLDDGPTNWQDMVGGWLVVLFIGLSGFEDGWSVLDFLVATILLFGIPIEFWRLRNRSEPERVAPVVAASDP